MSEYTITISEIRSVLGDMTPTEFDPMVLDQALRMAMWRYNQFNENIAAEIVAIAGSGRFNLSLENWAGDTLLDVAYLHWPAGATIAATTMENKLLDWWVYHKQSSPTVMLCDVLVDGATLPAAADKFLVVGVVEHQIEGMKRDYYSGSITATVTTIPKHHLKIIEIGAAAYALRAQEAALSIRTDLGHYTDSYHAGILGELAELQMKDFENELKVIAEHRLPRPPWSVFERKRLRRIE